jgi:hypothetical protein
MTEAITPAALTEKLRAHLLSDCGVMLSYALSSGKPLPRAVRDALEVLERNPDTAPLPILADLHDALLTVVAPATPGGLALIQGDERDHRLLHSLGPVPAIRHLMAAVFVFSGLFFITSISPYITTETVGRDIFNSSGPQLAWVLVFLLSAAGLGASFHALFDAYQHISDGSYDSKFDSIYWARIGLGLVSGLMLAELIPQGQGSGADVERPLLALLGGFSAAVVHRVLDRLVSALESVFVPASKAEAGSDEREIRTRVALDQAQQRAALASSFDRLLDHVAAGGDIDEARKGLVAILSTRNGAADAPPVKATPGNADGSTMGTGANVAPIAGAGSGAGAGDAGKPVPRTIGAIAAVGKPPGAA